MSKESWPSFQPVGLTAWREDQAFTSPQLPARRAYSSERGAVLAVRQPMEQWNEGKMEYWRSKVDVCLFFYFLLCLPFKTDALPLNPIFPGPDQFHNCSVQPLEIKHCPMISNFCMGRARAGQHSIIPILHGIHLRQD